MATPVTPDKKAVARFAAAAFGGKPQVREYTSDDGRFAVDLLWCADRPEVGTTCYSTVGLYQTPMRQGSVDFPTRLEICSASGTPESGMFGNILTTAAFMVMRTRNLVVPGVAIPGVVQEYIPDTPVPHLYFTAPFLWPGRLTPLEVSTLTVAWLMAIPISDAELSYLRKHGDDALETMFEEKNIDIYNINRASVL